VTDIPDIFPEQAVSLVKKYLTTALYNELSLIKTKNGFTLDQAIRSGIKNPDSSIGIYAGDKESYNLFSKIFNQVIKAYHGCPIDLIHQSDLTIKYLVNPDPSGKQILSFRIRVARNIAGFPFPPLINSTDRIKVEEKVVNELLKLRDDLEGSYIPLCELTKLEQNDLHQQHLLFDKGDRFMDAAGINRDWPASRGVFVSKDKRFAVWVNEEDHMRIISMDKHYDVKQTHNRLVRVLNFLDKKLKFAHDPKLGFLTSCPSNLGTGMRAGCHLYLPDFEAQQELINKTAKTCNLQIRGTHGEKTEVLKGIVDISNRQRLGITEKQCIETLHRGISAILGDQGNVSLYF